MAVTRHSMIAAEGRPFIYGSSLLVILLHFWLGRAALPFWLPVLMIMWFYRDPRRVIPAAPLGLVSPVDARVISVAEVSDPYLSRNAIKIVLGMSPLGVNSLRSVTEGKVQDYWAGKEGGDEKAVHIQTDEGDDVVVVLRPGRLLHRLSCNVVAGDRVGQGQRCGHILFGSRVDVYLPATARTTLQAGQTVHAGSELIGELVRG